ncbi:MAG: YidH family protein [Terriglobales bacterium]
MSPTQPPPRPDANQLAFERTWLAQERTLMAWVRTALSFITFGFGVYKFFEYEQQQAIHRLHHLLSPRDFGILIMSIGMFGLTMALVEHQRQVKPLEAAFGLKRTSTAAVVGTMVALFGIYALVAAILRG